MLQIEFGEAGSVVIAGRLDMLIPIKDLRKFAKIGEKCTFFELPEAAHMGLFEARKQCQTIILAFAAQEFPNS